MKYFSLIQIVLTFVARLLQSHTDWEAVTSDESDPGHLWLDTEKARLDQADIRSRPAVRSSNSFRVLWRTHVTNTMMSNQRIWKSLTSLHTVAKSVEDGFHVPADEQHQAITTK
jgi:hypothetical protein